MSKQNTHILVAEDLEANRFALERMLKKSMYKDNFTLTSSGDEAWEKLQENPEKYSVVLLDRMMPGLSGLDVLKLMKTDPQLKFTPVIFQTAMESDDDIAEGLAAGAHYYVTKPYPERAAFLSIIHSANQHFIQIREMQEKNEHASAAFQLVDTFDLRLKTLEEVNAVASYISSAYPDPLKVGPGILELLLNAVEHGNAGITYAEKTQLNSEGQWANEVNRRLALPENSKKYVAVHFKRNRDTILLSISDEGLGFHWDDYLEIDPKRAFDSHGRGIAIANAVCFDEISYQGTGSEVHAVVKL